MKTLLLSVACFYLLLAGATGGVTATIEVEVANATHAISPKGL